MGYLNKSNSTQTGESTASINWSSLGMPTFESFIRFASQQWLEQNDAEQQLIAYDNYCRAQVTNSIRIALSRSSHSKEFDKYDWLEFGRTLWEMHQDDLSPLHSIAVNKYSDVKSQVTAYNGLVEQLADFVKARQASVVRFSA